jgi:hypothetical protein
MVFDNTLFTVLAVIIVIPYPLVIVVLLHTLAKRQD